MVSLLILISLLLVVNGYLIEGIAQGVCRVGGDDEGGVPCSCQLCGEGSRQGGLAHAALAAYHDVFAGGAC